VKRLDQLLEANKDADGVTHFNRNASGCPHCGAVEAKTSEQNGAVASVFYHAGAECCTKRIGDQLRWRQGELDSLDRDLKMAHARVDQYRDAAENALSKADANRFTQQADRARASMPRVEREIAEKAQDINVEIQGLQRRRAHLAKKEAA